MTRPAWPAPTTRTSTSLGRAAPSRELDIAHLLRIETTTAWSEAMQTAIPESWVIRLDAAPPRLQRLGVGQPADACSGRDSQARAPQPGCARLLAGRGAGPAPGRVLRWCLRADDRSGDGAADERDRRAWTAAGGDAPHGR